MSKRFRRALGISLLCLGFAAPASAECGYVLMVFLTLPSGGLGKEPVGTYKALEECQAATKTPPPAAAFLQRFSKGESHVVCVPIKD